MARRARRPLDEEASKMIKANDEEYGKKIGYFESLNARTDLEPAGRFAVAKAGENILQTPVADIYVIVKGEGAVTVNGSNVLKPREEYIDGIRVYKHRCVEQSPAGQKGGIRSLEIEEGSEYKFATFSITTGGRLW